jgi:hypothetical protein
MSAYNVLRKNVRLQTSKPCCPIFFFKVTYDKNNDFATGYVTDYTLYKSSSKVNVLGKGNLYNIGFDLREWNTQPDGTGFGYKEGDVFTIVSDVTLYAQWSSNYVWLPYRR